MHDKAVHIRLKGFRCEYCDYATSGKWSLLKHIKAIHVQIKNDHGTCEFTASEKGQITKHIKDVHDKIRDNICDQCNLSTSDKGSLRKHSKSVHMGIKD